MFALTDNKRIVLNFSSRDSQDISQLSTKHFDVKLFTMSLTIFASIIKLGPKKLSNHIFTEYLLEETSQLMGALSECLSIEHVYQFTETVGLRTQFLKYFGPRAAQKSIPDFDEKERTFWIGVVQKLLKGAMTREGVRAKLPPLEVVCLCFSLLTFWCECNAYIFFSFHLDKCYYISRSLSKILQCLAFLPL